jgi:hypothetical protein
MRERLFDQAKVATRSLEAKNESAVLSKSFVMERYEWVHLRGSASWE